MNRKKYPILEFDTEKEGKINPIDVVAKYAVSDFPTNLIICFFKEVIDDLLLKKEIMEYLTINGENSYHFFRFIDRDIAIVHGSVGAPACVGQVEEAIALGAQNIVFCGGGGALDKSVHLGKIIIVNSAIRDEGVSYHYAKPSREIKANQNVVNIIKKHLDTLEESFIVGKVWTTDAFYRETNDRVLRRRKEGALLVEMEQAACIAVTDFRKVKYGAILYSGDDLSSDNWDSRNWRHKVSIRERLVKYCKDIVELL